MVTRQKPIFFFANLMNLILATGVFTLPFSLFETGFILGSLILILICIISIIASTFIIEVLAIQNCIRKTERDVVFRASVNSRRLSSSYTTIKPDDKRFSETFEKNTKITPILNEHESTKTGLFVTRDFENSNIEDLKDEKKNRNKILNEDLLKKNFGDSEPEEPANPELEAELIDEFYIRERYEISKLSNKIFNKFTYFLVTFVLVGYLYIGVTANGIIVGNTLVKILPQTFDFDFDESYYSYIVLVFYFLAILVSLNNINKLKAFGMLVMVCRVIIILLIFVICFYSMAEYGISKIEEIPVFNLPNITIMIGNSLFFFMSHHSIPGMVENFYPQKNLIKLLITGYFCSLVVMILYGAVSLLAFARFTDCDCSNFPCAIQGMFNLNFVSFPVVGKIINYYPLFNLINASIQLITLKNNILQAIGSCSRDLLDSIDFNKKEGFKGLGINLLVSFFIAAPSVCLAIFMKNIQTLMKYFSSTLGFLLMMVIPIGLIYRFRNKINSMDLKQGSLNKSFVQKNYQLLILSLIGLGIFAAILVGFFHKNSKNCVYDP